jgi:nucleoside-diphosphate-sugar epimerase
MKVLLAGADGAIGSLLTPLLIARGHDVLGLIRNPAGADRVRELGARPIVADALDRDGLLGAVEGLAADAVIHELTALRKPPFRARGMAMTNRLRVAGTSNLVDAAQRLGAKRMVTQSITLGYGFREHGDRILTESDPFGVAEGDLTDDAVEAMRSAEAQTFQLERGVAVRYGLLYGGDGPQMHAMLVKRRVPVFAGGLLNWVHHLDAAAATVAALENGRPGQAYNVVDDRAATWHEVITAMSAHFGAPPPRQLSRWIMRLFAPYLARVAIDTSMRVSNAKAKAELGWEPRFKTYVEGVAAMTSGPRAQAAATQTPIGQT